MLDISNIDVGFASVYIHATEKYCAGSENPDGHI